VIVKKKICVNCKKESYIWSKNLCKICFLKLNPIKKTYNKSLKEKKINTKELHELFLEIWDGRKEKDAFDYYVRCFETDVKLYERYYKKNSCCYHHLLEKITYPEYAFLEENIIIIHPDIHSLTHNDVDKTPKLKMYLKTIKQKLNI
jgi:hypothetical protein